MLKSNKNVFAKKKYGQNFLQDPNIIKKIVSTIDALGKDVIEIGPGRGAITKFIEPIANSFVGYEIDKDMIDVLTTQKILKPEQLIAGNFLEYDLSNYKNTIVIGNIPYYITSDIIFKLLDNYQNFTKAVLMVQYEVAQRLIAKKNSPNYSKLSVTVQYLSNVELNFIVPRNCFKPTPNVESAIVTLTFNKQAEDNFSKIKDFFKLCFLARRKKLTYALLTQYPNEKIIDAYEKLNFDSNIRIQQLDLEQIVELYRLLEK